MCEGTQNPSIVYLRIYIYSKKHKSIISLNYHSMAFHLFLKCEREKEKEKLRYKETKTD